MKHRFAPLLLLGGSLLSSAQNPGAGGSPADLIAKATELAIPASPAFSMLNDNTPARIERHASLHDIKVDWSLTNGQQGYNLSPGLAIEVQPLWLLFFERAAARKYRTATPLARTFSTLGLSIGTNAANDKNWLAWAAKINLYRQHDPLNDDNFLRLLEEISEDSKDTFHLKIKDFEMRQIRLNRRNPDSETQFGALADSITELEFGIQELDRAQTQKLADARDAYIQKHWNAAYLDLAFGRLLTYQQVRDTIFQIFETAENPGNLDTAALANNTLRLSKQGHALWLTGGLGLGSSAMLSAMVRYGKKPSRLTAGIGRVFSVGANLRYGSRRHNFFVEAFFDRMLDPLPLSLAEKFEQKLYTLTLGGDWRVSRNVLLSFGIRQTKDFENGTFLLQPLVNVNCLMR